MFWQIYIKLMLCGFLSNGHLCLIHYLKFFWPHTASTASLHQKGYHLLVKNWIFDDLFHKKLSLLVILVPVIIRPWGLGSFLRNWALEAVEASEVAEAAKVNEAGEVSKAWKITTVDFRVFQVLEFNNFRTNITLFWCFEKNNFLIESWKLMLYFSTFSVGGRRGRIRSKKFEIVDQA